MTTPSDLALHETFDEAAIATAVGTDSGDRSDPFLVGPNGVAVLVDPAAHPESAFQSAGYFEWRAARLPEVIVERVVRHRREPGNALHLFLKVEQEWRHLGRVHVTFRQETSDVAKCCVGLDLVVPLTDKTAPSVGIASRWTLRYVSEGVREGEKVHVCGFEFVRDRAHLDDLLAKVDGLDAELWLQDFFTGIEVNANLSADDLAIVFYQREIDTEDGGCFFRYSVGTVEIEPDDEEDDGEEVPFMDCSPAGIFC